MIRNYITIAIRNLWRQKFFTFINAFGLSIALAFCTLIYLFILDESRFDKFHTNKGDIYRLETVYYPDVSKMAWLPAPLGPTLKEEMPEIIRSTRFNEESVVREIR